MSNDFQRLPTTSNDFQLHHTHQQLSEIMDKELDYDLCLSMLQNPITMVNLEGVVELLKEEISDFAVETMVR